MTKLIRLLVLVGIVTLVGVASASASAIWPGHDKHGRGNAPRAYTMPEPSDLLMLSAGVSVVFALRRRLSLGK